jgi:hypothetical protein
VGRGSHLDLGFDRLGWVRVVRRGDETTYEVVGIARRRPRVCPISAVTARQLLASGLRAVHVQQP